MKILSIGNSFSVNAHRYLHDIAKIAGKSIETYNLYIGGCSLRTHYINMLEDLDRYSFFFNGEDTNVPMSIRKLLYSTEYDVITFQQASHFSMKEETYDPYIWQLKDYCYKYQPKAKYYIHQTWAYKNGRKRLADLGYDTPEAMFRDVESAYEKAYNCIGADGLIPSGKAMLELHKAGIAPENIYGDDIHASHTDGEYTLALTWLDYLTGVDVTSCDFSPFDGFVPENEKEICKKAAHTAAIYAGKYTK